MQRLKRWAGKQRRSLMLAGATAVVASLLALAAVYAVHEHERWQLGYLLLTTNGPHLKAEVLNERDALVTPTFTVPTQDWL